MPLLSIQQQQTTGVSCIFPIFVSDLQSDMEQLANSIQSISFEQLAQKIITVDDSMRGVAVKTINQATTLRNWIIGCYIVEYEQNGSDRAKYGDNLLKSLEKRIGQKGLNVTLFQLSRLFYRDYPHIGTLVSANHATALHKLPLSEIYATVSHKLINFVMGSYIDWNYSIFLNYKINGYSVRNIYRNRINF